MGDQIRTEVALGESRRSEVAPELLDVVRGWAEEEDSLEVGHGRPGAGGVVDRLHEENFLPQQIRLAVHYAHHLHLERTRGSGQLRSDLAHTRARVLGARTYGLGVEDEDLHAGDIVQHAVDVIPDERDQHHCCAFFFGLVLR